MPLIVLLLIAGGAFFYFFMWEDTKWPKAKTSLEAIDNFNKAVKNRDYKHAAKYCSKQYAELLTKADEAARKLGKSLDDLRSRMTQDGVSTKEMEFILAAYDPLPPTFALNTTSESEKDAVATVANPMPPKPTETRENWTADPMRSGAFYMQWFGQGNSVTIKLNKENDAWIIDFPINPAMTANVDRLVQRSRDYVNAFERLSQEIKTDRTVKEDVRKRLKELVEQAAKAEQ